MKFHIKTNDLYLLVAVAAYTMLFYQQTAGINFLIFTGLILVLLYLQTNVATRLQKSWYLSAGASLLTGISILFTGSELAVFMNLVSLILLGGFSFSPRSSLFVAAVNSLFSIVCSFASTCIKLGTNKEQGQTGGGAIIAGLHRQHITMVGIPLVISFLFLLIYASASQAFSYILNQLVFSSLSWGLIGFTLLGFIMLFGFFHQLTIPGITEQDLLTGNNLLRARKRKLILFKLPSLRHEYRTSTLLLVMLNILLLFFILSDGYYLTIGTLPESVVYAEYLHQGVYALILSILLAIAILLYVFRENLNFYSNNRRLKQLAYLWLALNVVLVILTLTKNSIYVFSYGLTYKRIGVYTYLTLTAIGLLFSFFKIARLKNNWYLFRNNAWALYVVMLLLAMFNWDRAITSFNIHVAQTTDYNYLSRLSVVNLPELKAASNAQPDLFSETQLQYLEARQSRFFNYMAAKDWQSWNYSDWLIQERLKAVNEPR